MGDPGAQDLSVIRRTYDLIAWFVPHLNRLPKTHRFGLGDRLVGGLYEFLEGLVRARWSREKRTVLEGLNGRLDVLRYQTRLLRDLGAFDLRRYEFAAERLTEIGSELGGWRKSVAARSGRGRPGGVTPGASTLAPQGA